MSFEEIGINVGSSHAWYELDFGNRTPASINVTVIGNGDVFDVGPVLGGTISNGGFFNADATGVTSFTETIQTGLTYLVDVYEGPAGTDGGFTLQIS